MFSEFPAPAGINRSMLSAPFSDPRVPRASGDKPRLAPQCWISLMSSPRQRG